MVFEYDSNKSDTNLQKHGIDFDQAQALWQDDNLLVVPLKYPHESRFLCVGRIGLKHWSAIVTHREGATRIISVRRSREEEMNRYENNR